MASQRIPNQEIEIYAKRALKRWISRLFEVKSLKKNLPEWSKEMAERVVVDLTVCSSAKMAAINGEHRGKPEPTDVLSFPASDFFWNQGVLGDLVLCGQVLTKQAREEGHPWKKEVDVLIVHGLLHLLGFDHEHGPKQAKEMASFEQKILGATHAGLITRTRA